MLRHAFPKLLEGRIIPLIVFLSMLKIAGINGAIVAALVWTFGVMAYHRSRGRQVPGLVILTAVALTGKSVIVLATGRVDLYFLQPTVSTALVGLAFLLSVPTDKPLAERLVNDVCPFDDHTRNHPQLRNFFNRLSLLWAFMSLLNFAFTLWLLLTQSITTFVLIKSFTGPVFTAVTIGIAVLWFRRRMAQVGIRVIFGQGMEVGQAAPIPLRVAA